MRIGRCKSQSFCLCYNYSGYYLYLLLYSTSYCIYISFVSLSLSLSFYVFFCSVLCRISSLQKQTKSFQKSFDDFLVLPDFSTKMYPIHFSIEMCVCCCQYMTIAIVRVLMFDINVLPYILVLKSACVGVNIKSSP